MPLVTRSESDMLRFIGLANIFVNPVNCVGSANSGLAKAIFDRWPPMYEEYRRLCGNGDLSVGKYYIYHDEKTKTTIVNLPTKNDWRDVSDPVDTEVSCLLLSEYLRKHPFDTVVMPILGIGYSHPKPVVIDPILIKHLDNLPNIIHLSVRPDRLEKIPLYLAVIGSRAYTDYDRIWYGVLDGLLKFEKKFTDFEAMVSGGANGVDRVACGTGRSDDLDQNIAKQNGLRPIVCQADWGRYGNSAGFIRNRTVADIGTHFVVFIGSNSVGTRNTIELVNRYNKEVDRVLESATKQDVGDIFNKPFQPPPEKKNVYICDISSSSK